MGAGLEIIAEQPFSADWLLPAYPNGKLVACGVDIGNLHCWHRSAGGVLVYGKIEFTACYANKKEPARFYFATITRYLSRILEPEQNICLQGLEVKLAARPGCILRGDKPNEVQVDGVLQLLVPVAREQETKPAHQGPRRVPFFPRGAESLPPRTWGG
ncbi:MAG: hypothetical protein GX952_05435 [Firmicutes bacterium]|nr:hypothetical protein [Bacillota bacterium]